MENLRFDEKTAAVLLSRAGKLKPIGFARAMKIASAFELFFPGEKMPLIGEPGDYLILRPDGEIVVEAADFIESHYEPVKTRARKNVPKS